MSFEIVPRGQLGNFSSLPKECCSISQNGTALFWAEDLKRVQIDALAVVLIDAGTLRIGLRVPDEGENEIAMSVLLPNKKTKKDTGRRHISVLGALKRMGLTGKAAAGRYALHAKGGLLEIHLGEARLEKSQTPRVPAGDPKLNPPRYAARPRT